MTAVLAPTGGHNPRSRHLYKSNLSDGGSDGSAALLGMTTCPLTPSPVWEGQTQRVPDLGGGMNAVVTQHLVQNHLGRGGDGSGAQGEFGGDRDRDLSGYSSNGSSELIHCVPTYLPFGTGEYYVITVVNDN